MKTTIAKLVKGVFLMAILMIVLLCGLYFYARYLEPRLIEVTHITIESEQATQSLRIVAFADLHLGNDLDCNRLETIMGTIEEQLPDVVVFLGDLFDNYAGYQEGEEDRIAALLALEGLPDITKLAVYGNHDLGGSAKSVYEDILEKAGYRLLVNQSIDVGGVTIVGSDDVIFGNPQPEGLADEGFNILLLHEPDYADYVDGFQLQLSGHTHGGQVRLPFLTDYVLPQWGRKYVSGLYRKPGGDLIYVTRGLGMSLLPYRFAARPEITVVEVKPL